MSGNIHRRHREILSAGVDWLTCSKESGLLGSEFAKLGDELVRGARERGNRTRLSTWQGYAGLRGDDFFYGWHGSRGVVTLSGRHVPALVQQFIRASDNVSRLDLQLTVEHCPPEPDLGSINYRQLAAAAEGPGLKPVVTVIHNTRGGHTNAVGSRISDAYGRNYDKGVEGKLCEPGRLWRYEVELKRGRAKSAAAQIALSDKVELDSARTVWRWWVNRGCFPVASEPKGYLIDTRLPERGSPDHLEYFERMLSKTVRAAVDSHGLHAVLRALGLHNLVDDAYTRKERGHGDN